jgi:hypothetical protein
MMNRLLTILLLAVGTAYGQINNPPTSVNIVDATATGRAVLTATNAAAAATAVGLGTTNDVQFNKALSQSSVIGGGVDAFLHIVTLGQGEIQIGWGSGDVEMDELALTLEQADWKFYKPFSVPNATNRAIIRTNLELGAANNVTFSNITASGTLGVSDAATFSTNVTVNGNLSVGSLTTTTPSTWALDATETAAATNGVLDLPSQRQRHPADEQQRHQRRLWRRPRCVLLPRKSDHQRRDHLQCRRHHSPRRHTANPRRKPSGHPRRHRRDQCLGCGAGGSE